MKKQLITYVKYDIEGFDPRIHALNAFFTCFVDYEHSSKDFSISTVETDDAMAVMYFGATVDSVLVNAGHQTKNLYKLVKFITEKELWPTVTKKKGARIRFIGSKIESDKTFSQVVEALRIEKDPELNESIRTYDIRLFRIAYTAVGEVGHNRLMGLQPGASGRLAYSKIKTILRKSKDGFFKRLFKRIFKFLVFIAVVAIGYSILASGYLSSLHL
ncbi:hypothetical protein [Pseudomonas syringae group genomosp. 3]|uniref:Uncharacterized protein n=1 Tax=Pseudomonas syringae pv. coriandricola TaxID=264453 RepID=A0A3M3JJ35_9PSED|nr:hypothetical protein [Pseudomonas syringae group genomosp. 3]RMN10870.1 hypothetical protein ALQ65_01001 [Pseudomonas syringae pv. coriandricola]